MPSFAFGRHGRVDTVRKARQLLVLVQMTLSKAPVWPPSSKLSASQVSRRPRVRILSLLNGILIDKKEVVMFRDQLAVLTQEVRSRSETGEQDPESCSPSSFASGFSKGDLVFDFHTGMSELGVEYSYLNFVVNWPLGMRL